MTDNDFIEWLRKELYEMLYNREIDHDVLMVRIISISRLAVGKILLLFII